MAKVDPPFCVASFEVQWALAEGQFEEAKKRAAASLRGAHLHKHPPTQEFLDVVAELLDGKKSGRRTKLPVWLNWTEVGSDYKMLEGNGRLENGDKFTHKGAIYHLAEKWKCSEAIVKAIITRFQKGRV